MVTHRQPSYDYHPRIDGLRAIAVLAVIFNHIDHRLIQSGYLGVDVFFVISGFVITLSLHRHTAKDLKSFLAGFYARRFRRIVPALLVCIAITACAAWLLDPDPGITLKTGLAALVGVSNLYLLSIAADYFAQTSAMNFLTHTWSLGVEEQFYVLFPFLMWFTNRQTKSEPARATAQWLLGISVISVALLFFIPGARGGAAYFLPLGRLWELAAGALMALAPFWAPRCVQIWDRPPVQISAALLLIAILFLPVTPSALWALAIVPPTMILLLAPPSTRIFHVLSFSPFRWVGRVSYSLYLWHWPVITITLMLFRPTAGLAAIQFAATLVLATLTYYSIEQVFRRQRSGITPSRLFTRTGLVLAATTLALGILLVVPNTAPLGTNIFGRLPQAFPDWPGSSSKHERDCVLDGHQPITVEMALSQCTLLPTRSNAPTLWVMGDSHAGQLRGLLGELHQKAGFGVHLVETPGIPFPLSPGMSYPLRTELFSKTQNRLRKGDVIVLARLLYDRADYLRPAQDLDGWVDSAATFAAAMKPLGVSVVVMGPVPIYRYPSIARCAPDRAGQTPCDEPRQRLADAASTIENAIQGAVARAPNLFYFDTFSALCPSDRVACSPVSQRVPLYRDRDHLNAVGSTSLADAFLHFLRRIPLDPITNPR